jgi:hypothetical protein
MSHVSGLGLMQHVSLSQGLSGAGVSAHLFFFLKNQQFIGGA